MHHEDTSLEKAPLEKKKSQGNSLGSTKDDSKGSESSDISSKRACKEN